MKIETQPLEDHQVRIVAELETEALEKFMHQAARVIAQKTKIPGFRPGKAPYDTVKRYIGEENIRKEAIELLIDEIYPEVLKEANIQPAGPGKLDAIISEEPPSLAFIVPLAPEVVLGDYTTLQKEYHYEPVTDEDVQKTIDALRKRNGTAEPVERPAEKGDVVSYKITATFTQPEDGEEAILLTDNNNEVEIGAVSGEEGPEWPYAGFSEKLIGLTAGAEFTDLYTYPADSEYEKLQGKEVEFQVSVLAVKQLTLAEENDDFAQSVGRFDTFDALRTSVRTQMEQEKKNQYDDDYFDDLVDQLIAMSSIKYSPVALEQEIDDVIHNIEERLSRQNLDLETYLKVRDIDRDDFRKQEVEPIARHNLERSLVMDEFAHKVGIQVNPEDYEEAFNGMMEYIQNSKDKKFRKSETARRSASSMALNAAYRAFNQRILAKLKAIATGEADQPVEETVTEVVDATADPAETDSASDASGAEA